MKKDFLMSVVVAALVVFGVKTYYEKKVSNSTQVSTKKEVSNEVSNQASNEDEMLVSGYALGEIPPIAAPEMPDLSVKENPNAKITSIHLWEQYFVYAVALGVSDKVVKAYRKALDMGIITDTDGISNLAYSPIFNRNFSRSFSNLNGIVSKTNSRANSTIASTRRSSSSGGGGGFSSGSSGGGGSRGGGGGF